LKGNGGEGKGEQIDGLSLHPRSTFLPTSGTAREVRGVRATPGGTR